jgi:hypothetical protein
MNGNCMILYMSQLSKLWNNESRFILLQNLNCLPIRNILHGRAELKRWVHYNQTKGNIPLKWSDGSIKKLVLLWAQLTKIYPPLPTSVQPISITKTLLIVPTKYERDPPLFTGKLLIKFQNILRTTTQVIIRHMVKILFSVISSPITLEWQKWKSLKMKGILLSSPVNSW